MGQVFAVDGARRGYERSAKPALQTCERAIWMVLGPRIARYGTVRRSFLYSVALRSDNLARCLLA